MGREITEERARKLHPLIRERYGVGQPEGYGIVCAWDGEHWGSTYRLPDRLLTFECFRSNSGRVRITMYRHANRESTSQGR